MSEFVKRRKREYFYRLAKEEKYRARSAYKLLELQKKFHLIKEGNIVLDLGATPGSWSQVALGFAGNRGLVLAVDILPMAPLPGNFVFVMGDIFKESTFGKIKEKIAQANVVLSDAAPEFSGIRTMDIGRAMALNEQALEIAGKILKKGGNFACKAFSGTEFQSLVNSAKKIFAEVKTVKPAASLKGSAEMYIVGLQKKY